MSRRHDRKLRDGRSSLQIKVGNNLNNNNNDTDTKVEFLLDSGAACSLLHTKDFQKLALPATAVSVNNSYQLVVANGTKLAISRRVLLNLTIGGQSKLHPFYVSDDLNYSIIGWDAMKKYNIVLANGEFFVDGDACKKLSKYSRNNNVLAKRAFTLKAGQCKEVLARIRKPVDLKAGEAIVVEDVRMANDERRESDVRVIPGVYDVNNEGNIVLAVCNISPVDIAIKSNEIVRVFDTLAEKPLPLSHVYSKEINDNLDKPNVCAVFDPLVQPPVDQFRPDYKHIDVDLDNIISTPLPKTKVKTVHDLLGEMNLGPMNAAEKCSSQK